jgi:hypothetical protein
MAGFEGPREPGTGDHGSPKLPSWAVTRSSPELDTGAEPPPLPDGVFPAAGPRRPSDRADPPVVRVPEHPFDVEDPFGDKQLGGTSSPWIRPPADDTEVRVVDLADEFHLTTAQALEVCAASGTPAASGAAWLTLEQAAAFRTAVVTYDRTESTNEEYPSWAVPPGGRRPGPGAAPGEPVPGATLLARTGAPADDEGSGRSGSARRIVALVVVLVLVAALVAVMLLT